MGIRVAPTRRLLNARLDISYPEAAIDFYTTIHISAHLRLLTAMLLMPVILIGMQYLENTQVGILLQGAWQARRSFNLMQFVPNNVVIAVTP